MSDHEYIGCIHVHSDASDGSTPAAEMIDIARRQGLDFLVITDHGRDTCRQDGLVGWHGGLLCLSAPEIGGRGRPHFLAFNPTALGDLAELERGDELMALGLADRGGATNFIAHPHPARMRLYKDAPVGWSGLETTLAFGGIEIWSYMHDVCDGLIPWRLYRIWKHHESLVRGPRPETLALWDALCQHRRVAGIGASDNHALRVPIIGQILPHADLFRLHRTHVVCDELPADGTEAERALTRAMADGRVFVAMDGWADATGFRIVADGPTGPVAMGDEAPYAPGMVLKVSSPEEANLTIVRDGQAVKTREKTTGLEWPVDRPGVYRVEARLGRRPWVFTNPIYLRGNPARTTDDSENTRA